MAGKLYFTFERGLTCEQIDLGNKIQFGLGFTSAELTLDGKKILELDVPKDQSPVLELVLETHLDPLSPTKGEQVGTPVEGPEVRPTFEEGSSSATPFTSKNQRKNYLRRVRKKIAKARKGIEIKTLAQVEPEAVEDLPIPASSPLLRGSRFHPLAAAMGEERVTRIARAPPCPVDYSTRTTLKEKQLQRSRVLRNMIHTCAAQVGETKEQYVRHLKGMISHRFEKEILKEEKSDARNLTPQPVRRNKKFARQPVTSAIVDGYHRVPRPPSSKMEGIVLTGPGHSHHFGGRLPVPSPPLPRLASVVIKTRGDFDSKKVVEAKGKRPKSPEKKDIPKKFIRPDLPLPAAKSVRIPRPSVTPVGAPVPLVARPASSVPSSVVLTSNPVPTSVVPDSARSLVVSPPDPPVTPGLTLPRSEDSAPLVVEVVTSPPPTSPLGADIPHSVEDATLLTTHSEVVEGERMIQDDDERMIEQLMAEPPTAEELKLQNVMSKISNEDFRKMMEANIPIDSEMVGDRPIDEVVREIKEILKKKETEEDFDPDLDDMLVDEDDPATDVYMVETRGSIKETEPSKHRSCKDEGPATLESDSDDQTEAKNDDAQVKRLEARVAEMLLQIKEMQAQVGKSHQPPPSLSQPLPQSVDEPVRDSEPVSKSSEPVSVQPPPVQSQKDIKKLIEDQVREALAHSQGTTSIPKGRPYPEEYDLVPYPKGFVPPTFKIFTGIENPRQHLAHFRASCCNAGGSDALLFRQFVSSLSGIAFEWYADLPNGSVRTFNELENLFLKRFSGAQQRTTVGDLVIEKQKPGEPLVDYILRWRNLSMKCEPQLQEQHAVEILLKNIHGPVAFLLKGFTIKTFEKLLNKASNLQEEAPRMPFLKELSSDKKVDKPVKSFEKKAAVSSVDKGKQPVVAQPSVPLPQPTPTRAQAPVWEVDFEASQEDVELPSSPVVADTTVLIKKEKSENFVERKCVDERCIRVADGGVKTLSPLMLSDFYFAPSKAKGRKINKRLPSASILMINHDSEMQIDVPPKETLISNENDPNAQEIDLPNPPNEEPEVEPLSDSDFPEINFTGNPIVIELSDSSSSDGDLQPMESVDSSTICSSDQIVEVQLRGGKVLPPRLPPQSQKEEVSEQSSLHNEKLKESKEIQENQKGDSSDEDDIELVAFRPLIVPPRRGGRMAQRARGRSRPLLERNAPPIYLAPTSSSDEEPDQRGVRIPFEYQTVNVPPKFDLTLDSDSDQEVDNPKVQNDGPELTTYEKLNRRIEALSLTPLSAGRIAGLEIKEAPNLHREVGKVQKFFPGSSSSRDEGDVTLEEADFNELMELPFGYFPPGVRSLIAKGFVPCKWTKGQARYHEALWHSKNNWISGIGFGTVSLSQPLAGGGRTQWRSFSGGPPRFELHPKPSRAWARRLLAHGRLGQCPLPPGGHPALDSVDHGRPQPWEAPELGSVLQTSSFEINLSKIVPQSPSSDLRASPSFPALSSHHFGRTPAKSSHGPLEVLPPVVLRSRRLKRSCSPPPPPALREKNPFVGAFSKPFDLASDGCGQSRVTQSAANDWLPNQLAPRGKRLLTSKAEKPSQNLSIDPSEEENLESFFFLLKKAENLESFFFLLKKAENLKSFFTLLVKAENLDLMLKKLPPRATKDPRTTIEEDDQIFAWSNLCESSYKLLTGFSISQTLLLIL
ncbi:hypothetical protein M5K25_018832 [Dendrobium thyrsiflorum]|uniref:Retrotransposon gag domain-containing protein n=1 Tax=Dendrobium thyrsiflorum TaxID=117978 RepID=A0ABD0UDL9_DENTH